LRKLCYGLRNDCVTDPFSHNFLAFTRESNAEFLISVTFLTFFEEGARYSRGFPPVSSTVLNYLLCSSEPSGTGRFRIGMSRKSAHFNAVETKNPENPERSPIYDADLVPYTLDPRLFAIDSLLIGLMWRLVRYTCVDTCEFFFHSL